MRHPAAAAELRIVNRHDRNARALIPSSWRTTQQWMAQEPPRGDAADDDRRNVTEERLGPHRDLISRQLHDSVQVAAPATPLHPKAAV